MAVRGKLTIFAFLVFLLSLKSSYAAEGTFGVFEVYLNEERKGEFIVLTKDGDYFFKVSDFLTLGFKDKPEEVLIDGKSYISLNSNYPLEVRLDETTLTLHITVSPELLKTNVVDLSFRRPYEVFYPKENTAFFNYALTYSLGDDFQSLTIPSELGVRFKDYLTYLSLSYRKTRQDERLVRLMSNIIHDDRERLRRITLGDFIASSWSIIGGVENLGGIKVAKEYLIDPYFVRYPPVELSGYLQTPSELELYYDGILIRKERLPPGRFELLNIPLTAGFHKLELLIRDIYGREERLIFPFYFTPRLLRPGLHEYSYGVGFKREGFGRESFRYSEATFLGYHRLGLTSTFTAGFRGEVDGDILNLGPMATFTLGRIGSMEASTAISYSDYGVGYGGSVEYSYGDRTFGIGAILKGLSRKYANLSIDPEKDKPRFEGSLVVGFALKRIGSLSIGGSITDRFIGPDTKKVFAFFSRTLFRDVSLSVSGSTSWEKDKTIKEFFGGLHFYLGKDRSGSFSYQQKEDDLRVTASLHKNPPFGEGFGYRVNIEKSEDRGRDLSGGADLQYRGRYGIYSADYRNYFGEKSYHLSLSGGIAFIDKSFHLSRPITDSFALVKVADLKGVGVYLGNLNVGKTGKKGELLVPGLLSYHDNKLSIADKDIPIEYTLKELERYLSPPLRGGATVRFDVRKLQDVTGRLFLIKDDKKVPPEFGVLTLTIDDKAIEGIVGKGGEFYIEDVKGGRFEATLFYEGVKYSFDLLIPVSDERIIDLGEIVVYPNRGDLFKEDKP